MRDKKVNTLVVDTTAFVQNAPLHEVAENIVTCQEVVNEITNKRQLRRLVVLPYDLVIKDVFPENIKVITDFSKKTGDYQSLSSTDIKVMALTYQLEKEMVGIDHLRTEPIYNKVVKVGSKAPAGELAMTLPGFYMPGHSSGAHSDDHSDEQDNNEELYGTPPDHITEEEEEAYKKLAEKFKSINVDDEKLKELESLKDDDVSDENYESMSDNEVDSNESDCNVESDIKHNDDKGLNEDEDNDNDESVDSSDDDDDDSGWITPSNVKKAIKEADAGLTEEKSVQVGCMTTDFAMQNVLKQMNLNVCALDGRIIKQLRTFILRCYTCFKTTSIMTKQFCPKCGNNTLKKVACSLDEEGKLVIHINGRRPLTGRGKIYSMPAFKGGKHPNNPIICEDQPMPDNRPTRKARTKVNILDPDYIADYSPFAMRDTVSRSALLGIKATEKRHWMQKNPNEARRRKK